MRAVYFLIGAAIPVTYAISYIIKVVHELGL